MVLCDFISEQFDEHVFFKPIEFLELPQNGDLIHSSSGRTFQVIYKEFHVNSNLNKNELIVSPCVDIYVKEI